MSSGDPCAEASVATSSVADPGDARHQQETDHGSGPLDAASSSEAAASTPPTTSNQTSPTAADKTSPREGSSADTGSSPGGCSNAVSPQEASAVDSPQEPQSLALSVHEVYEVWCGWLNHPEEGNQLEHMLHMLTKGGEPFRSFVQFMARVSEPHRSAGLNPGEVDEDVEDQAMWRSCTAMRVACHAFTALGTGAGLEGVHVLNLVCYELLGGLQPRSRAASMHICTVLQHLLSAHDHEACNALLHYHAPFVLIRALIRPGCAELLLGLLLGVDAPLPALNANQSLRSISLTSMQQVLQYLRQTSFAGLVAAILDSTARKAAASSRAGACSPAPRSPAPRRSWQSPGTPGWQSPGGIGLSTPQRLATPKNEASPLSTLPAPPSSPSTSIAPNFMELPVEHLQANSPPISPQPTVSATSNSTSALATIARSPEPRRLRSPAAPRGGSSLRARSPSLPGSGGSRSSGSARRSGHGSGSGSSGTPMGGMGGVSPVAPSTPSSNRGNGRRASGIGCVGMSPASGDFQESEDQRGVAVLVEFLTCILDTAGRASELLHRSKHQQDKDAEHRAEARLQVLQMIFVESALIPHLFRLFRCGVAQFESAALLHAILQHALNPHRRLGSLIDALLGHYVPHVEMLGNLLLRHAPRALGPQLASGGVVRNTARARRELRLNSYTVQQPLGALRVSAVQILAALSDLAPERTLLAMKPAVWGLLVQWFFVYRCNHIFQAACGRLFVAVIQHGTVRLQHLLLVKLKLLGNLCETVLAEGACGDRWHDLRPQTFSPHTRVAGSLEEARVEKSQVATSRRRHPGGLGGITPVIAALAKLQKGVCDNADTPTSQKAATATSPDGAGAVAAVAVRQPLAPRAVVPQASRNTTSVEDCHQNLKPAGHSPMYIARLLGENANWPQVVGAVSQAPSR